MESFTKIPIFKSYSSWLAFNPTVFPVWIRFFVNFFLLENSNSDDSESNEYHDKGVKRVQRSPQTKRKQRAPVSRKGQGKIRSKPSVAFESTSSTSPTDEQTRKLAIKGKAVTVRDPKDDETFLVSVSGGEGGTLNGPRPYRLEKSSRCHGSHMSRSQQTVNSYFSSVVRQCKWPSRSRKIVEVQKFLLPW